MSSRRGSADDTWKRERYILLGRIWSAGSGWNVYEKACAEAICQHAPKMYPSMETIADRAGCSKRRAQDAVNVLVNGNPGKGLPPVFVKSRRPKGDGKLYPGNQYDFVRDPDALEAGRAQHAEQGEALAAALAGKAHPARRRVALSADLKHEKERLEERIRKAGVDVALGSMTDEAYRAELRAIGAETKRLARRAQRKRAKSSGAPTAA